MRLLTHHRRPGPGSAAGGHDGRPGPVVLPVATTVSLPRRLEQLQARSGAFHLAPALTISDETEVEPLRVDDHVEVVVITVADEDPRGVATLRPLRRLHPGLGVVVVGHGTEWFEEAFDLGADAWVDHSADDDTLLAAIHRSRGCAGYRFPPSETS
jgi:DNA-binding NarL/FixJ family response regulator